MSGKNYKAAKGSKKTHSHTGASGMNKYTSGSAKYSKSRAGGKTSEEKPKDETQATQKEKKILRGKRGLSRIESPFRREKHKEEKKPRANRWPAKEQNDDRGPHSRYYKKKASPRPKESTEKEGIMRLNKFLSNAGIASRREADDLIKLGLVKVNGKVVTELGMKVDVRKDVVQFEDKTLRPERFQYVLLNKPKDYITTMEDDRGRNTVMALVSNACKERIYPVGRLDRNTTGLLLFTNDGDLAKRLTHPRHGISKLYHVELTTKVSGKHLDEIREGIKLEDGYIKADEISFVNDDPYNVGIKIHSGKNRIVRRIFEHFGYTVKKLDRVMFAGLTKKDLPRGRYRHLTEKEVGYLKMIS